MPYKWSHSSIEDWPWRRCPQTLDLKPGGNNRQPCGQNSIFSRKSSIFSKWSITFSKASSIFGTKSMVFSVKSMVFSVKSMIFSVKSMIAQSTCASCWIHPSNGGWNRSQHRSVEKSWLFNRRIFIFYWTVIEESSFFIEESLKNLLFLLKNHWRIFIFC